MWHRIRPLGAPALLCLGAACVDHAMSTEPEPLDVPDDGVVLYAGLTTYPLAGTDREALASSMSAGGAAEGRRSYIGYHRWDITWALVPRPVPGGCAVADATVYLDSRITLPVWDAPANTEPRLLAEWRAFVAALHEHEVGHQALVLRGARQVRRALLESRGPGCDQALALADTAGQEVLALIRAADAHYDAETRHGATQGAVWPPPPVFAGYVGAGVAIVVED